MTHDDAVAAPLAWLARTRNEVPTETGPQGGKGDLAPPFDNPSRDGILAALNRNLGQMNAAYAAAVAAADAVAAERFRTGIEAMERDIARLGAARA